MAGPKQEGWQGKQREFTEDQDGKQDWEGWDGKTGLHGAGEFPRRYLPPQDLLSTVINNSGNSSAI
jgi:hypothetical protein